MSVAGTWNCKKSSVSTVTTVSSKSQILAQRLLYHWEFLFNIYRMRHFSGLLLELRPASTDELRID